ncbi:hypothetical protein HanIR_Chr04g0161341 [Helianthus annuus]|nr:hypothetical protein HanIR_Chr04g0161341 [Helianthus annuus]
MQFRFDFCQVCYILQSTQFIPKTHRKLFLVAEIAELCRISSVSSFTRNRYVLLVSNDSVFNIDKKPQLILHYTTWIWGLKG